MAPVPSIVIFNDGYFYIFSYLTSVLILLSIIAFPYFLHKHFRENNTRSVVISWIHILATVTIMITLLIIFTYTPPTDIEYQSYPLIRPNYARWRFFNDIAILLFLSLVLVQITYLIYGVGKLFQQNKTGMITETTDLTVYQFNQSPAIVNPAL
jgi:hypothetical protein